MPHQKQRLQNRVWRADPIYHTPLSLTDSSFLSQHGACSPPDGADWICWPTDHENHGPQTLQVQPGWGRPQGSALLCPQLSRGSASKEQPPYTHTEAEIPLHCCYFPSPSPAFPLGKQLPSQSGGGQWALTLTVHMCTTSKGSARDPSDHFRNQRCKIHNWLHSKYEIRNCTKLLKRASTL